ncbi:MAG TPA: proline dehydrogenase [Candidatus Thalassarchaeaceae archaeon]|jgi:proline dehydrogenase|nr:proline dehydrogenase [Euryarchaeota archaeon]DAC45459.1 MAG TPA: proline dehydrogenase [Candidatus Poseidoniales archaeon]HII34402.1 proline dehydrogenase [Candidatus Thalassarchaeaceae archaeon]|tara:strand:+ start:16941 stop:17897 length:957 start_codon:yes stop_codon:yes gene_type:complete
MALLGRLIVATMPLAPKPIVRMVASRYVAGPKLEDAISTMIKLSSEGACFTVDVLGEEITSMAEANFFIDEYSQLIDSITKNNINAHISIKPTAFGLLIDQESAFENILNITKKASDNDIFVRLDMEDSRVTDSTIELMTRIRSEGLGNIGVVLQGRLFRTISDIENICEKLGQQSDFRICKGIYLEPKEIAHTAYGDIVDSTNNAIGHMLRNGAYTAIASHDYPVIENSLSLLKKYGLSPDSPPNSFPGKGPGYEFQFLLGVRGDLRRRLSSEGHLTRIYVPYGLQWYEYGIRRLKENPEVATHVLKALLMPWTNRR